MFNEHPSNTCHLPRRIIRLYGELWTSSTESVSTCVFTPQELFFCLNCFVEGVVAVTGPRFACDRGCGYFVRMGGIG
jgi:hypothetical protein